MKKQFEYKKGIATRINHNPEGFNKHKVNTKEETEEITREAVQQAYRELMEAKRNTLSKAQIYARMHKQFLGLDKVDLEFKG
jgi:hypothetical protein